MSEMFCVRLCVASSLVVEGQVVPLLSAVSGGVAVGGSVLL